MTHNPSWTDIETHYRDGILEGDLYDDLCKNAKPDEFYASVHSVDIDCVAVFFCPIEFWDEHNHFPDAHINIDYKLLPTINDAINPLRMFSVGDELSCAEVLGTTTDQLLPKLLELGFRTNADMDKMVAEYVEG